MTLEKEQKRAKDPFFDKQEQKTWYQVSTREVAKRKLQDRHPTNWFN
jgi:hypothetical protein